jgi:hypothetical protein
MIELRDSDILSYYLIHRVNPELTNSGIFLRSYIFRQNKAISILSNVDNCPALDWIKRHRYSVILFIVLCISLLMCLWRDISYVFK